MSEARISAPAHPIEDTPRWRVILALGVVYFLWGAAFLATRFAVQTLPPFLMSGFRFTVAGTLLFSWARLTGAPHPTRANWRAAAIVSLALMVMGMGLGAWAFQFVASGIGSVLVGTMPMWMVLLHWLFFDGPRPGGWIGLGLVMGLAGIILIVGPDRMMSNADGSSLLTTIGMFVFLGGAVLWAAGSLYARTAPLPSSRRLALGMELLVAGLIMSALAVLSGDIARLNFNQVALRSILAMLYLIFVASILVFSAYFYLLKVTPPAIASTYAYVNPVVAIFLGWAVGNEPLTLRILAGCAIVITGVAIITVQQATRSTRPARPSG